MFFTPPFSTRITLEKEEQHPVPFIPMVYERFEAKPVTWEYRVLSINPSEESLPTAQSLNDLGQQGWMLVGLLSEPGSGKSAKVHYYFLRQANELT